MVIAIALALQIGNAQTGAVALIINRQGLA
jgi:hypothetical protein